MAADSDKATRQQGDRATSGATNERWEAATRQRLAWNFCGTCSGYLWTLSNLLNPRQQNNLWPPKSANNATSQRGVQVVCVGDGGRKRVDVGWWRHLLLAKGRTGSNRRDPRCPGVCHSAATRHENDLWQSRAPDACPSIAINAGQPNLTGGGGKGQLDRCPDRVAFVA